MIWPGDSKQDQIRDVLAHKPTVLTVDFGMNDGGYQPFNEGRFGPYMKGLQGMADRLPAQLSGAKTLLRPRARPAPTSV